MLTTVRLDPEGSKEEPFVMTVLGFKKVVNFTRRFDTMGAAWSAAREVGEEHRDWLTAEGPGWKS